ncbi:serine protease P43 [Tribolium castaneum]|uniref:Serine protease P43 n=1 Tax=Tribolium castaneum TaxID=7070 RepID=A0A139W9L3_TRICA|nr:serine protease P43 [Tribolium castaneum]
MQVMHGNLQLPSNISSTKCEEYAKAVYVQTISPVLSLNAKTNNVSECGIVSVPLIIGGTAATEKEFPHMAVIGYGETADSQLGWDCGGTLISELYVLTAAHCLESRELGPSQLVRFGTTHLDEPDPDLQERVVVARIPHPDYKPPLKANDIGLIKLEEPVEFTPHVRPACLNTADINPGRKALASGFGKLSYDAETGSKNLMKVLLNVYPNNRCSKAIREQIKDTMLCAGHLEGGKDTCQGDSGGPLQIVLEKPYCMYSVIGVTSFGKFCGFANAPAIYTKISAYISWIESIVWK